MLDIKFVRMNPDVVKENIKKKYQDEKLPLVDEVLELDQRNRDIKQEVEGLRAERNKISKQIGACMAQGKKEEADELKKKVQENADRVESLSAEEKKVEADIKKIMIREGALNAMMSGSGPTVFGLFVNPAAAETAYEELRFGNTGLARQVYLTSFYNRRE